MTKRGIWQLKDIDDRFFLEVVSWLNFGCDRGPTFGQPIERPSLSSHWAHLWDLERLMPMFPSNLIRKKAERLIQRRLLTGCPCGCRGDFEVTDKGASLMAGYVFP